MNDTHPEMKVRFRNLMMSKTGQERLLMGCSMYDTAKEIVRSSINNNYPGITPAEMRREIFLRFYGHEFSQPDKETGAIEARWPLGPITVRQPEEFARNADEVPVQSAAVVLIEVDEDGDLFALCKTGCQNTERDDRWKKN